MTKKKQYILQDYVSRPDSIKHHISELSWNRGIENFFLENVPFSYSTGLDYADRIISLIHKHYLLNKKKTIKVLEIGSGSGLLAYRILYLLHKQKRPYAKHVQFIITDFSEAIINQIKKGGIFSDFKDQVSFKVLNFLTDDYKSYSSCDIVLMTYLLDSVPYFHLHKKGNKLYETKIQTTFDEDYYYVDTTQFPPLILKQDQVKDHFLNKLKQKDLNTLSRSSRNLDEHYKQFLLHKDSPIYNSPILKDFLAEYTDKSFQFNYSENVCIALNNLFAALPKNAMILIFDFGIPNFEPFKNPNKKISAKYGITMFHSTFFPLIDFLAKKNGLDTITSQFVAGDSQCCLITKSKKDYKTIFNHLFTTPAAQVTLKIIPLLQRYKGPHVLTYVNKQLAKCAEYEKLSHTVLLTIAILLKNNMFYEEALDYLDVIYIQYGDFSLSSVLLKAEIYNGQKEFHKTVQLLEPLIKKHRYYNGFYYQLCIAYVNLNEQEKFISTFKKFLYITDNFIPWRFFIIMACFYYELKQINTAEKILRHLIMCHSMFPTLIEQPIALTANNLLQQWKRTKVN